MREGIWEGAEGEGRSVLGKQGGEGARPSPIHSSAVRENSKPRIGIVCDQFLERGKSNERKNPKPPLRRDWVGRERRWISLRLGFQFLAKEVRGTGGKRKKEATRVLPR